MVCEAKIKIKILKNTKKKNGKSKMSFVGKNTNNLLEMQCCKRTEGKKRKKSLCFAVKPHPEKTKLQPFLQIPLLQLNETLFYFL